MLILNHLDQLCIRIIFEKKPYNLIPLVEVLLKWNNNQTINHLHQEQSISKNLKNQFYKKFLIEVLIDNQRGKRKVLLIKSTLIEFLINQRKEKEFQWDLNQALFRSFKPLLENPSKTPKFKKQSWKCNLILQKHDKTQLKIQSCLILHEQIQQTTTQVVNNDFNFETCMWSKTTLLNDEEFC